MLQISDARIDELIAEDVPYVDLTTEVMGIGGRQGTMRYFTREGCVVAGTPYAARVAQRLGCAVSWAETPGARVDVGAELLVVRGSAECLHKAWKVGLNLLDHLSAVATKTRAMVDEAHAGNPRCEVMTTRKSMPGAKDLLMHAVMAGGAWPRRLGLSETILVFENHTAFCGGFEGFLELLDSMRSRCVEKKLFVEANAEQAIELVRHGVDGIQLDKIPVEELSDLVRELRAIDSRVTLVASGGIDLSNARAYAATGVDALATTAPYNAKPVDMSARMTAGR
jgi:molybdenum transport protein